MTLNQALRELETRDCFWGKFVLLCFCGMKRRYEETWSSQSLRSREVFGYVYVERVQNTSSRNSSPGRIFCLHFYSQV
jgi:hypothetical protein